MTDKERQIENMYNGSCEVKPPVNPIVAMELSLDDFTFLGVEARRRGGTRSDVIRELIAQYRRLVES